MHEKLLQLVPRYQSLLHGAELVESQLKESLPEYLNAEIALRTVTDVSVAIAWLKGSFFYIRVCLFLHDLTQTEHLCFCLKHPYTQRSVCACKLASMGKLPQDFACALSSPDSPVQSSTVFLSKCSSPDGTNLHLRQTYVATTLQFVANKCLYSSDCTHLHPFVWHRILPFESLSKS